MLILKHYASKCLIYNLLFFYLCVYLGIMKIFQWGFSAFFPNPRQHNKNLSRYIVVHIERKKTYWNLLVCKSGGGGGQINKHTSEGFEGLFSHTERCALSRHNLLSKVLGFRGGGWGRKKYHGSHYILFPPLVSFIWSATSLYLQDTVRENHFLKLLFNVPIQLYSTLVNSKRF